MKKTRILLGVTGGIAAYKSADLCSKLLQADCEVQVVMTPGALNFVSALTFQTLSRRRVYTDMFSLLDDVRVEHIAIADWAELAIVAPATADFLAKYAHGLADDALTTVLAAFSGTVLLAPAMNPKMWAHAACQDNVATLRRRGVNFVGPNSGPVACGSVGVGRMAEVAEIIQAASQLAEAGGK